MTIFRKKRFYFILLLPVAWLLTFLGRQYPWGVENYYSTTIFPFLSGIFGRFWSIFPFSVAEWLILATIILVFLWLARFIRDLVQKKDTRKQRVASFVATAACLAGCVSFLFVVTGGLNYSRPGFAILHDISVVPSSQEQLESLCQELLVDINHYSQQVATKDGSMIHSASDYYELSKRAGQLFTKVGVAYPALSGYTPPTKPVLLSKAMSYGEITGVYFPFTFECNVNVHHPDYSIPFTMMHELAHSKGFMQENEANFIAYLACLYSDDSDFLYSGSLMAFVYAGNAFAKANNDAYWSLRENLGAIPAKDLIVSREYWKPFQTPIATISSAINDTYLKANKQMDGVASYGQVVDLLLAYFKEEGRI